MLMRPKPKMLHRLPRILRAPQQQRPCPRRLPHRQLIQRKTLPARLLNACPRRACEPQCRDAQFGDLDQAVIVGHGSDDDDGLVRMCLGVMCVCGGGDYAGEGHGWAVGLRHEEAAENGGVEAGVSAACMQGQ